MVDEFTEVTSEGWLSRITSSIKSMLFGLLLFVVSFPLLWWNEGRAVKTARSLEEGAAAVVSVAADKVEASNENKLVHMSGTATTEEVLQDSVFAVSVQAIKLKREVEMYQWREEEKSETKKRAGGKKTTTTTYSYHREWSGSLINSGNFKQSQDHQNPSAMAYESTSQSASKVTLGAFVLSSGLVGKIDDSQQLNVTELPSGIPNLKLHSGGFYLGANPASPQIGDIRINFRSVPPAEVSVVAQQLGDRLAPYSTKAGRDIELLESGVQAAAQMFAAAMSRNKVMTWVLRLVGFLMMFFGLTVIFKPLVVVADVLPMLGNLLSVGLGLFCGAVAFILSLLTIAIAWIAYRPLLGGGLLVLAVGVFFGVRAMGKKKEPKLPPLPT